MRASESTMAWLLEPRPPHLSLGCPSTASSADGRRSLIQMGRLAAAAVEELWQHFTTLHNTNTPPTLRRTQPSWPHPSQVNTSLQLADSIAVSRGPLHLVPTERLTANGTPESSNPTTFLFWRNRSWVNYVNTYASTKHNNQYSTNRQS